MYVCMYVCMHVWMDGIAESTKEGSHLTSSSHFKSFFSGIEISRIGTETAISVSQSLQMFSDGD